jgi:acid phosphatase family membrane protein YuiD
MKFIIIPVIVMLLSQLVKVLIYLVRERKLSLDKMIWEGFWAGKFPSSHSAVLASSFYLLIKYSENLAVTGFAFFVCLLFLYGLLEDKKRNEMLETYFVTSNDVTVKKSLKEFSGHGYTELFAGLVLGVLVTVVLDSFALPR